jgi:uncharacterized ion transporter superfamily protein YfcC
VHVSRPTPPAYRPPPPTAYGLRPTAFREPLQYSLSTSLRVRLPHPFVLLLGGIAVAILLTWILPAGTYQRRIDSTGRERVVAGTYARVPATPVGLLGTLTAAPRGIVAGADVVLTILFVGGAVALVDRTGALARLVAALVRRFRKPYVVVALVCSGFAIMGAVENMYEEIVAMVPVLVVLSRGLGFGPITALGMSVGAAVVGSAFGPTNPFQTGLALRFADLPGMSQPALRFALLPAAVALWIGWTIVAASADSARPETTATASEVGPATRRDVALLALVLVPFVPYAIGVVRWGWGFDELSGLFLIAGFAIGLASGRSLWASATGFLQAMEALLAPALYVGTARGISVVLTEGKVLDTIVHGLSAPLAHVPGLLAAWLMVPVHAVLHVPVPSSSGHAALTMPIMAPLADLMGVSRDAAVIAYQTGAGLMDLITPTNGALLAMLVAADVSYARWLRFAVPGAIIVSIVGFVGMALAR